MRLTLHSLANLLVHPRHGHQSRRPHLLHRNCNLVEVRTMGQRHVPQHQHIVQVTRRHMRERKKRDATVLLAEIKLARRIAEVVRQVAMRQHHALGLASGARCVYDRRQIVRLHQPCLRVELRIARLHCLRAGQQLRKSHDTGCPIHRSFIAMGGRICIHHHNPLQRGQLACRMHLLRLLPRRDHHNLCAAVAQHVPHLLGGQRGIQRNIHGPQSQHGEVRHRPLPAVLAQQGHAVALAHSPSRQTRRQRAHPPIRLHRSNRLPRRLGLRVHCRIEPQPESLLAAPTHLQKRVVDRLYINHSNPPACAARK